MIRWITPFLGTAPAGSPDIAAGMSVVDVRDLVDKHGNDSDAIRMKLDQGVALLAKGLTVVICCDYGISRSNAIAAGLLSRHAAIPFDEAVREVRRTTGEDEIKLEPLNAVRAVLQPRGSESPAVGPRLLVTGGSGFIGSALRRALDGSMPVVVPTRQEVDLTSGATALDGLVKQHSANTLVHLANPRVFTSAHAMGDMLSMLRNILDVCRENRLRLIHLSHWEVYAGYRSADLLANEHLPLLPKGPYGEAKMLCEALVGHYRQMHGVDAVIIRPATLFGPGSDRPKFLYNFLAKALSGEDIRTHDYANGSPHLDLMHVEDLVAALIAILHSDLSGDFNIGTGQTISTYEVASTIIARTASRSGIVAQSIHDHAPNIRMDYRKAHTILGWQPRQSFVAELDRLIAQEKQ